MKKKYLIIIGIVIFVAIYLPIHYYYPFLGIGITTGTFVFCEEGFIQSDNKCIREINVAKSSSQSLEFDGVIIDNSLDKGHWYSFLTNEPFRKFNTGSSGIRLQGIDHIDDLHGKHVHIFGTIMQNGEENISVEKLQILDSLIPTGSPFGKVVREVSFDDLFDNPDPYYNQMITMTGELREHDYPLAYAGVGCDVAQFKTSNEFAPDFNSRHQLYDGTRYISVRIGGSDDVGYSEYEKLPTDLKNKQVTITGVFVPNIKDKGECVHTLYKSGYILTDFEKITAIK